MPARPGQAIVSCGLHHGGLMANFDAALDEEDAVEPPTDKWTIEDYDPETDDPPEDHHFQGDDPPGLEDD